jgi:hypothetical protein
MKKIILIITIALLFATNITAQTTTDNLSIKKTIDFYAAWNGVAIDSAETIYSQVFDLANYNDASFYSYPLALYRSLSSADSIHISAYMLVNYVDPSLNAHWIVADTLFVATTATATKSTANLNNVKAPYYKIKLVNDAGSKANTIYFGSFLNR